MWDPNIKDFLLAFMIRYHIWDYGKKFEGNSMEIEFVSGPLDLKSNPSTLNDKLYTWCTFQKQLEALLDEICTTLPVDQTTCDDTVNGMFEALISLFESYKPEEVRFIGISLII